MRLSEAGEIDLDSSIVPLIDPFIAEMKKLNASQNFSSLEGLRWVFVMTSLFFICFLFLLCVCFAFVSLLLLLAFYFFVLFQISSVPRWST